MAASLRTDLQAVWLVQGRKFLSRLEFWLLIVGYDRETHSFSSRIYLLYLIIFFSIWGMAVLVLLAGFAGQILSVLPFSSPTNAALAVGGIAFIVFFLLELYSASRRSPFEFSEADSQLLCFTPVDRRIVGIIWFIEAWLVRGIFLWPGFVVLAYALQESQAAGEFVVADLPRYMLSGLRMLVVAVPLHLAAQSLAWSAGAWRLQGKRDLPLLRWVAPLLAIVLVGGWILSGSMSNAAIPIWLQPLIFPLAAGTGEASLPAGLLLGTLWAALGLFILWAASRGMSLARAAQETRGREARRAAILTSTTDLAEELRQREHLGIGRKPSRLPLRPGLAALVWRNAIQGQRSLSPGRIFSWLGVFGLTIGIMLIPDWGARAWSFVFWCLLAGQQAVRSFRRDLKRWWLMHQLPYSSEQIVAADLTLPTMGFILSGAAALIIAWTINLPIYPLLGWLFFPGVLVLGLSSVLDILLKCKSEHLLAGEVPGLSLLTVVLTTLVLGLPGLAAWLMLSRWSFPFWLLIPFVISMIAGAAYLLYRLAGSRLRNIR